MQIHHLIPARRPDLAIINKKKIKRENLSFSGYYCRNRLKSENERKQKRDWYIDLGIERGKLWNMEVKVISVDSFATVPNSLVKLKSWKSEEGRRPPKLQHYLDSSEY